MSTVKLEEFNAGHLELLSSWLRRDHVKTWYPNSADDLDNARELCAENSGDGDSGQFLIVVDDEPVGYLRWQLVPRVVLDEIGLSDIPNNAADVDLLIGERERICKGLGGLVLQEIEQKMRARGDVPAIGLTTDKTNRFAHKAFERAGYEATAEYSPDGYGECYLYTKSLV